MKHILLTAVGICLGLATLLIGVNAGNWLAHRLFPQTAAPPAPVTTVVAPPPSAQVIFAIGYEDVDFTYAIEAMRHSVVSISISAEGSARDFQRITGSGSGFIFYKDNNYAFIATNNHVVENTTVITISLDDEKELPARLIGACPDNDLAVLAVELALLEQSGKPFSVASLGDSNVLRAGDNVVAMGNALGRGQRTTQGIVSATGLNIRVPSSVAGVGLDLHVLQTDAAVNRGNSGGPLINQYGEVVGIITAKFIGMGVEGMGYVLPISNVSGLLETLRTEGSVVLPFMGIRRYAIDEELRELFNLPSVGIWITAVTPNTPAYEAGLLRGDLIVRFGDVELTSFEVFRAALIAAGVGETVVLGILRDGQAMDIEITLGAPPW